MNNKANKLAMTVLALSLTQTVTASERDFSEETEHHNTYWGVGIGSVLGAVIAGPPGAAIGATLGGSMGWGQDQTAALEESLTEREQQALTLKQTHQTLAKQSHTLKQSEQALTTMQRTNQQQAARLSELEENKKALSQNAEFLSNLANSYAQDIYFQTGQFETPDYAQNRLENLVELLKNHPDLHVTLTGFTDAKGSKQRNQELAQARVDSIKAALSAQGIDESRVTGLAVGEIESVSAGPDLEDQLAETTPKPHVLERRVSIVLNVGALNNHISNLNAPTINELSITDQSTHNSENHEAGIASDSEPTVIGSLAVLKP